ncbi:MAG: threonine/serine dehydratase [Pseudomonadota bacterium]
MTHDVPTIQDIREAADRIASHAVRTPLVTSPVLDALTGARVFLKAENLQRTGSFKFRGAFHAVSMLDDALRQHGVVACSSGNHAQGVADAAAILGLPATIVMPKDAPDMKKVRTKRLGATVVEYDRYTEDRDQITQAIAERTGAALIHPYETIDVLAGQGTAGLEAAADLDAANISLDRALICAGGGGLMAGMLLALRDTYPDIAVHPVEPDGHDDQRRSHAMGKRLGGNNGGASVCDAIVTPMPGALSFSICQGQVAEGLTVTDEEALAAVAFAWRELKLVVEPGGAVALAALLSHKVDVRGETVLATLSGGNIDPEMMVRALATAKPAT